MFRLATWHVLPAGMFSRRLKATAAKKSLKLQPLSKHLLTSVTAYTFTTAQLPRYDKLSTNELAISC